MRFVNFVVCVLLCFPITTNAEFTGFKRSLNNTPWGHAVVNHPVRKGAVSERFELRAGDCSSQPGWSDCDKDRERTELSELAPYTPVGVNVWYAWSFLLDSSWVDITPVTTTIGQFHQRDQSTPVVLFVQRNNQLLMRLESAKDLYPTNNIFTILSAPMLMAGWHDVVVNAKWSTANDGLIKVWVDGRMVLSLTGVNTKYDTPVYFKYGIYRSFVSRTSHRPPHVIWYDEVRKGYTRESVDIRINTTLQN